MRKKEYLNEEEFQKNNKKVKIAGTIVIIIGLCLLSAAIYVLISGAQMEVPVSKNPSLDILGAFDVDSEEAAMDWLESTSKLMENESKARSTKMDKQILGMFMLIPGIFITIVGCMIRFFVGNQRNIMAYQAQQVMPIAQEGIEKMAPSMGNAAKEVAKGIKEGLADNNVTYCKHCGAQIDEDSNFCSKCGKQL